MGMEKTRDCFFVCNFGLFRFAVFLLVFCTCYPFLFFCCMYYVFLSCFSFCCCLFVCCVFNCFMYLLCFLWFVMLFVSFMLFVYVLFFSTYPVRLSTKEALEWVSNARSWVETVRVSCPVYWPASGILWMSNFDFWFTFYYFLPN